MHSEEHRVSAADTTKSTRNRAQVSLSVSLSVSVCQSGSSVRAHLAVRYVRRAHTATHAASIDP